MAWILYEVAIELAGAAAKVAEQLNDADLARQLRRAAASVPLNLAEGSGRTGRARLQHYRIAFGSAREVKTILKVAQVMGHGEFLAAAALADRVCGLAYGHLP